MFRPGPGWRFCEGPQGTLFGRQHHRAARSTSSPTKPGLGVDNGLFSTSAMGDYNSGPRRRGRRDNFGGKRPCGIRAAISYDPPRRPTSTTVDPGKKDLAVGRTIPTRPASRRGYQPNDNLDNQTSGLFAARDNLVQPGIIAPWGPARTGNQSVHRLITGGTPGLLRHLVRPSAHQRDPAAPVAGLGP